MRIGIENVGGAVKPSDLRKVVVALNKQLAEFGKFWSIQATCQLGASSSMDAIIYLQKDINKDGILGYHDITAAGKPFGIVFTALSKKLGEPWTVTLSHEVLELAADPEANRYCTGEHPYEVRPVFYWYEVCDPCQAEHYMIDGVAVSNFVLPLYFTPVDEKGTLLRNDYLRITGAIKEPLSSLWLAPGGYAGFFDPETGDHDTVFADAKSEKRHEARQVLGSARRAFKYKSGLVKPEAEAPVKAAKKAAPVKAAPKKKARR